MVTWLEKPFRKICGDCPAERRIKSNNVTLPISFCFTGTGFVKLLLKIGVSNVLWAVSY